MTVRVKVCGVTRVDEARAVAAAGVDWLGLNFYPQSPRCVSEDAARAIVAALPAGCTGVGLFVDRPADAVAEVCERVGLGVVQLHGQEPAADLADLRARGLTVVRAVRLGDEASVAAVVAWLDAADHLGARPDHLLVDALVPGRQGGTGHTIAAGLVDLLRRRLEERPEWKDLAHSRLILAGGLTPENVAEHVRAVRPGMVDVASGVETAPGRKDLERVRAFVAAARGTGTPR